MSDKAIVSVITDYRKHQSNPSKSQYAFSYTISIQNVTTHSIQLLSRHWIIQDSNGKTEEVYGEGVVGEKPLILPGDDYTYTSGTVLETDYGTMEGSYFMVDDKGNDFTVSIPKFLLSVPRTLH